MKKQLQILTLIMNLRIINDLIRLKFINYLSIMQNGN